MFKGYDPKNLQGTALNFDEIVNSYLAEYEKVGLQVNKYSDIDSFVKEYLEIE